MQIGILIQARLRSARLPCKVLLNLGDSTVLGFMIDRLVNCRNTDLIAVIAPDDAESELLQNLSRKHGVGFFKGDECDLLDRYCDAADFFDLDAVVRVTSDCPLVDPMIIETMIEIMQNSEGQYDLITNCWHRTFARGLDVEVLHSGILRKLHNMNLNASYREHVTLFLEENPDKFNILEYTDSVDNSDIRLTIDEVDDYITVSNIVNILGKNNSDYNEIIRLIRSNPAVVTNRSVRQKVTRTT